MLPVSACLADDQVMLTIKPGSKNTKYNKDRHNFNKNKFDIFKYYF